MNDDFKVMVIGAHPDDCDIISGCTTVQLLRDAFTTPREIRPDIVVDATPYIDRWYGREPTAEDLKWFES